MPSVGKNIAHDSAVTHVAGRSEFLDDRALLAGELWAGVVPSPVAHGRLVKLDVEKAKKLPGVAAVLTAADVPAGGTNIFGPVVHDEALIVDVDDGSGSALPAMFLGQPVAIVAAESKEALRAAVAAVEVEMEALPPILTIDEAIAADSFLGETRVIARGDLEAGFAEADAVIEGELEIGGQEQFYLESQIAIAVPGEQRQMQIYSSTQHPTEVQMLVAETLGIPANHVVCECKRMGGAFGGKETQAAPPAMMAALLAQHTGRAVRFMYGKDDDMRYTGKRHPFKSFYKVGYTKDGRITALDVQLYSNGGCSTDLSPAVLERALLHTDNTSYLPNMRVTGRICKTNLPSNTAFRGFGGPQGIASTEYILQEIAQRTGLDAWQVRRNNCYEIEDRNVTPYGQIVQNNMLPRLFDELHASCDYAERRKAIDAFNATSKTHLKGMAMSGVKFGISFTRRALNQANALVNIYLDGSVMVSTGATEMGQGVYTRIRQVTADALGVDYGNVIVAPTSTDKNNNTSPTAASSGTDLNGNAARVACEKLQARLRAVAAPMLADAASGLTAEPEAIVFTDGQVFDSRRPNVVLTFVDVVKQAYELRVSLGERGFYATPGVDFNRETGQGTPFLYFTNGTACSEVLIDRFTGEMQVTRVDLLMDLGNSINPGIDRGQVVGGFVQGMGWCTTEELIYSDKGDLLAYSPTTYKIPNMSDVPAALNVAFLDNPDNTVSLHRSKAVGEPPLMLGLSAWLAAKDALDGFAKLKGVDAVPTLALPATGERMLAAMGRVMDLALVEQG